MCPGPGTISREEFVGYNFRKRFETNLFLTTFSGDAHVMQKKRSFHTHAALSCLFILFTLSASAQMVLSGRLQGRRFPGSSEIVYFKAVKTVAARSGPGSQAVAFRTWEMHPAGWYYLPGMHGHYTVMFTGPAHFIRPATLTNIFSFQGEKIDRDLTPRFDYAVFFEGKWDAKAATDYYQTFTAQGTGVTQVGFRVVHDGIDGGGPGGQDVVVSIHEKGPGTPDTWKQVGQSATVLQVDSGGPKNYIWSAGWNSGQVPLTPGTTYAVHIRPKIKGNTFQTFWKPDPNDTLPGDCYRAGAEGPQGYQKANLWMSVATDGDGLLIPYNKCVHKEFGEFAGSSRTWSQSYVAQGSSLASVVLYAAVSGAQPSLNRQRVSVRVRSKTPDGEIVGVTKTAIGNGNYTGDASWGTFCAVFAPGEVPLVPGERFVIEFQSIENYATLHGFENIKGVKSKVIPAFNPYRKIAPDAYEQGTAYKHGRFATDFDLDMQVIEYAHPSRSWKDAVRQENLVANGQMEAGIPAADETDEGKPEHWTSFSIDPGTMHRYLEVGERKDNRVLRIAGGSINKKTVDGGYLQQVVGLNHAETYRLKALVRSSWPVDEKHQAWIGWDRTGQTDDPEASTIHWLPASGPHGTFAPCESPPLRPENKTISVWLRAKTALTDNYPFRVDFDAVELKEVQTDLPRGVELNVMSFNIRYGTASDGVNHWEKRYPLVFDVFRDHRPDVAGVQEALHFQLEAILKSVPEYASIGVGRSDGKTKGEYSAILYKKNKYEVLDQDTFWFSDTPEKVASTSWGNSIPRICTWGRFKEKSSGKTFYVYNLHLDHRSQKSRERSVELLIRRINARKHSSDPFVITGDFNAGESNTAIRYLRGRTNYVDVLKEKSAPVPPLVDTFRVCHGHAVDVGTFGGFTGEKRGAKIDYIFAPQAAEVLDARILHDQADGRYPSDHYPVQATLLLPRL